MDRWPDWAGREIGKPNDYVNQLMRNLGERTGHMPFLRIGANSQDRASTNNSVQVIDATFPPPTDSVPNPEADHIFIGRDFYALSGNLPAGTSFMWGLNLKALNITETRSQARLLADAFQGSRSRLTKHVNLVNVEIGNEPDVYGPHRLGPQGALDQSWTATNYSSTWLRFAKAISREIDFGRGRGKPKLSIGALTGFEWPEWGPEGVFQGGGLDDKAIRAMTSQYAGHAYSGGFDPRRLVRPGDLMDKLSIRANMTIRTSGLDSVKAMGLDYVLVCCYSF
jgi:hypothetical protein